MLIEASNEINKTSAPDKKEWTTPTLKKSNVSSNTASDTGSVTDGEGGSETNL